MLRRAVPSPNSEWLARIVASWCAGEGAPPDFLGLPPGQFRELRDTRFPGFRLSGRAPSGQRADFSRMLERDDLVRLLNDHGRDEAGSGRGSSASWWPAAWATTTSGSLGPWARQDLSALIRLNFPDLAARNGRDMKWKKFLYKQLCESEGIYLCRAPSREICSDDPSCFGPEE